MQCCIELFWPLQAWLKAAKNAMAEELIPQSNLSHVQVLMKRSHVQQAMSSNNKENTVTAILENTTVA